MVFLGPKANVKLVPQIDVAWLACHAAPPSSSTMSPYSCPLNTKLSPDAERPCCALPIILPSSFFSALHSCLLHDFIRRTNGHSRQTFRSVILVLPISCSFPSYSCYFFLLARVQRVTWTLVFCASSQISCVFILRLYGLGYLACSDAELTSETESLVDVGYVWWAQRRYSARTRQFSQWSAMRVYLPGVPAVTVRQIGLTGVSQRGDCSCWRCVRLREIDSACVWIGVLTTILRQKLYLVHTRAPVSLYQTPTYALRDILNHRFVNTVWNFDMCQPLKGLLQVV
jgi:hypothetical protein